MWRVVSGALRLDAEYDGKPTQFVRLALPGDVIGVERWAKTDNCLRAYSLVTSIVEPIETVRTQMIDLLVDAVVIAHQRSSEALELRRGPVAKRVQKLLMLFGELNGGSVESNLRCELPHLVDMADVLDAAPETISRVFSSMRDRQCVQERKPQAAVFDIAALSELGSIAGMSASRTVKLGNA
ncbi:MAG: Crp/Fnr family transcriptional regulator [Rhodoferax sp.]|nr:MAG: Crp/Fnr family transcriptional regulator [Rhodoferax sp.]